MLSSSLRILFWDVSPRPISTFYAKIPAFYAEIPCYLGFYARYRAWCTVGERGVPWVDWRLPRPRTCFYPGVKFKLPTQFPIPDPSPAPVTSEDWGAELRGSSVSRTSQRRLRFVHFPNPVLAKWVIPFSLPCKFMSYI